MARAASIDDDMVSNGLASYNGALVGCAFSVFLPGSWDPAIMIASALGGAWTPILAVALKNTFSMPQWTLAAPTCRSTTASDAPRAHARRERPRRSRGTVAASGREAPPAARP